MWKKFLKIALFCCTNKNWKKKQCSEFSSKIIRICRKMAFSRDIFFNYLCFFCWHLFSFPWQAFWCCQKFICINLDRVFIFFMIYPNSIRFELKNNIIFVSLMSQWIVQGIFQLHNFSQFETSISQMNKQKLFNFPRKHLLIIDEENYDNLMKLIKQYDIYPMSNVIIAFFKNASSAVLIQPYKIGKEDDLSKLF